MTVDASTATRLPPGPPVPKSVQAILSITHRRRLFAWLNSRYGGAATVHVAGLGTVVVVTDPDLAKQVFLADSDVLGTRVPNLLTRIMGADSVQGLNGVEHWQRRQLLSPPLNGKRVRAHQDMIVAETMAEIATWPEGEQFATLPAMLRITLNVMLRILFGAGDAEIDELRRIIPAALNLGARLVALPTPPSRYRRFTPWGRLDWWRQQYEDVVDTLIDAAQAAPDFGARNDVLSWLLRDGVDGHATMSRKAIGDELLSLLVAGHDTTATALAWVFERISRQPELLTELAAEVDAGGDALRRAAICEAQRTRTVTDYTSRHVYAPVYELGDWAIPQGCSIRIAIGQIHQNPAVFPDPDRFDPQRYLNGKPSPFEWMPYGGGTRRCPGSHLANLELDVVVRTVLRQFTIQPTATPGEKHRPRGLNFAPQYGGQITVQRRVP